MIQGQSQGQRKIPGAKFLIGGAARQCLARFARLSGGARAHIAILPHASGNPAGAGNELAAAFAALGVGRATVIKPRSAMPIPADATAAYLTGGDQARLVRLVGPELLAQLTELAASGGVLGGSSAGAMAFAPVMIADGMNDGLLRPGALRLKPGLSLLSGTVVDTHFRERGRFNRLIAGVSLLPGVLGIGLDEDTAIEIDAAGNARVQGSGHAWFFQSGVNLQSTLDAGSVSGRASVSGVEVACLSAGESFHIQERTWKTDVFQQASRETKSSGPRG